MDVQNLLLALQNTYNPAHVKEAEAHLKQWESVPGYIVLLLQIVASNEVDPAIRQAGSINLKNMTKKWRPRELEPDEPAPKEPQLDFPESDRQAVKDNIIEALIHAPPLVQSQLASAISSICGSDFPVKWDSFIPKIANFINTQNPQFMLGALTALLMAFKRYTYITSKKKRNVLNDVVKSIFPLLLQLFGALSTNDSIESAAMQRLICKMFYYTTNMGIPPFLVEGDVLGKWVSLFTVLLEKPIPEEIQPADHDDRPDFPWWGAKKWAARIFERAIRKYGQPNKVPAAKKHDKAFATAFSTIYSVKVMESLMRVMGTKRGGAGYLPDKFAQTVLSYLRICLRFGITYSAMKPHVEVLTQEILFPYLCLSDVDKELWEDDPVEYLRKEFDPIQEFHNPRTESINFLTDLVMYRGKASLNKFMGFVVQLLVKYTSSPDNVKNYREKDGCLHAIGSLAPWLKKVPEYKQNLERMLLAHVFPEFSSPFGFLRARACWIFSQFYNVKFSSPELYQGAISKVLSMMHDPDLPVRVQAGLALRFLILAPSVGDLLKPFLPQILEAIFKLMNEIDSDDLVATLERLIFHYGEEIAPFSVALCGRLAEAFMKYYKNMDEEDDETSGAAAMECLMALRSMLRGVRNMPHIYAQINPILVPMLLETFTERSFEFFDELLRILTFATFYGDVTPMWPLYTLMYSAFELWASDFVDDMVPSLDNFISRGTETFLSNPVYLEIIMKLFNKLVGDHESAEHSCGQGTELMESVLHNCRGRVDHILPDVLTITASRLLNACEAKELKVLLLEVFANSLYYNPALTLQIMEAKGLTAPIFTVWFQSIPLFKRMFDIKLAVLGLSAMFELPVTSLPPIIQQGAKQIFEAMIKMLKKAEELKKEFEGQRIDREQEKAQYEKEEKEKSANGADEEDPDDEVADIQEVRDEEDVDTVGSDDEDMDLISAGILDDDAINFSESEDEAGVEVDGVEIEDDGEEYEEEDEDDDDDDDYDSSDDEYITPIDKVDELVYFSNRIHTLLATPGLEFQGLLGSLPQDDQKELHVLLEASKTRDAENAKREQERLQRIQQRRTKGK